MRTLTAASIVFGAFVITSSAAKSEANAAVPAAKVSKPIEQGAVKSSIKKEKSKAQARQSGPMTTERALELYGERVRAKLKPSFSQLNVPYPPAKLTFIALKKEMMLYIFAPDNSKAMKRVLAYPIIGASGVAGPKLKEGDKQVPEGFYKIPGFRPNVVAHLGLDVNYPNDEDKVHAKSEKRTNLGYDILIHGSRWSTGCLAMGNEPIEEMFVLAHDTGLANIDVIFAPCNLLVEEPEIDYKKQPRWVPELYQRLRKALSNYKI